VISIRKSSSFTLQADYPAVVPPCYCLYHSEHIVALAISQKVLLLYMSIRKRSGDLISDD